MTNDEAIIKQFLEELETEATASRKCLERIPESTFGWKPHEKSMNMGYLSLLVAGIPNWIYHAIEDSEINLATYKQSEPKATADLVKSFDENIVAARRALQKMSGDDLKGVFSLKRGDQLLFSSPKKEMISQTINHWVHHRGQLTVYMRLNNLPVPSIYGPSADERIF